MDWILANSVRVLLLAIFNELFLVGEIQCKFM